MFTRSDLKGAAKTELKWSYWLSFGVAFVASLIMGIGGGITGRSSGSDTNQIDQIVQSAQENSSNGEVPVGVIIMAVLVAMGAFLLIIAISSLYGIFVSNPIEAGKDHFFATAPYGNRNFEVLFSSFKKGRYGKIVKTLFLRSLYLVLWSLLCALPAIALSILALLPIFTGDPAIMEDTGRLFFTTMVIVYPITLVCMIPAFVKSFSYMMVPYIVAENPEIGAKEAITMSREMMNGHKWFAFVLQLSFFWWYWLGILTCGIGFLFLAPYLEATQAQLYLALRAQKHPEFQPQYYSQPAVEPQPEIPAQ
ncbi:MAG: DUF975 family protein [Oscillospiraceae bacterium]|nr:DUF975 family protein [Oscillospiraceae bacterium]